MPPRKNPESAEIRKRNPAKGTESKIVKAQAELSEQQQLLEKEFETTVKLPYIINFIYQYLVWIYSSILYLSKINVNMATVDRGKAFNNKILILGDDFAAGVGDKQEFYKVQGITGHLQMELARLHEIKQTWRIYNLGVPGSTSQDWLLKPGSLLDKVLKNKEYNDCKIVILMLGLVDCKK